MDANEHAIQQAILQFSAFEDIHSSIPDALTPWTARYVTPVLRDLWGVTDIQGFYAKCIAELCDERPGDIIRVVSIGCGDAAIEVETCARLVASGRRNLIFAGADVAAGAIERGRQFALQGGVEAHFDLRIDRYDVLFDEPVDVVIANQVLHHIVDLEGTFSTIARAIGQHGIFVSCDMIGRNGHMLWPEALAIMDRIWAHLPERYKFNSVLNQQEPRYSNWDNSREANEGIRAEDFMPVLLDKFKFERFFAAGNLAIALFGRHYGGNFHPNDPGDLDLINQIAETDFNLIDLGYLKPVLMYASMSNRQRTESYYRHWTPEFCVRRSDPAAEHYVAHRYGVGNRIHFETRSPAIACLISGWSSAEYGGVWSNAPTSVVEIQLKERIDLSGKTLRLVGFFFQPEGSRRNRAEVTVNDCRLNDFEFQCPTNETGHADIDLSGIGFSSEIQIRLDYQQTFCPAEMGIGADPRRLAFRLVWAELLEQ